MDVSMVFGIVFTVIVIAIILVFGGEQLAAFFGFSSQAQVLKEIKAIQQKADKVYYMAENSGVPVTISIPSGYKICFLNTSDLRTKVYSSDLMSWKVDPAINTLIKNNGYNIWYSGGKTKDGYTIANLVTEKNFCTVSGMEIYLKNTGYEVEVIRPGE